VQWSRFHDQGHGYEMLTRIDIGLFLYQIFLFHPSILSLLKIKHFYFFYLLFMRMVRSHNSGREFVMLTWIGSWLFLSLKKIDFFSSILGYLRIQLHNFYHTRTSRRLIIKIFYEKRIDIWHLVLWKKISSLRSRHLVLWSLETLTGQQRF
jgi:hypothetical protein